MTMNFHGEIRPLCSSTSLDCMSISHLDRVFLNLAVDLARRAWNDGDAPFGSVLVSADDRTLVTDRNRTVTGSNPLLHPEFTIAEWAVANLTPQERSVCTVYTSGEHCPMCAAAHGWAGLGRIVYASSSAQLASWPAEYVRPSPVAPLQVQDVVPGIVVDGPDEELAAVVRELHRRPVEQDGSLIGGRQPRHVEVVPYDPAWPGRFAAERGRIIMALGTTATRVEHIGSTSVPGLAAKPVIDINVSVEDVDNHAAFVPPLTDAGYELRVSEPGHVMFRTPDRDVHIHVCDSGSAWERRHPLFRDWLRESGPQSIDDREAYGELKLSLSGRTWEDMAVYNDRKGPLIAEIMARAERWAEATGWHL
jgi:GrpB-like predicted nucleotidyltransferase (UPF0157 family)/tRNA(Arg) A34 adenosine deaminase TadA